MQKPTTVYNDNSACVQWSSNLTTKGLRHIQIRENAVRESVLDKFIIVKHIEGKINLADIFTKEDRDSAHFIGIRNILLCSSIPAHTTRSSSLDSGSKGGVELGVDPSVL